MTPFVTNNRMKTELAKQHILHLSNTHGKIVQYHYPLHMQKPASVTRSRMPTLQHFDHKGVRRWSLVSSLIHQMVTRKYKSLHSSDSRDVYRHVHVATVNVQPVFISLLSCIRRDTPRTDASCSSVHYYVHVAITLVVGRL